LIPTFLHLHLQCHCSLEAWNTENSPTNSIVSSLHLCDIMPHLDSLVLIDSRWYKLVVPKGESSNTWTAEMHDDWFAHLPKSLRLLHLSIYPTTVDPQHIQSLQLLETLLGTADRAIPNEYLPRSLIRFELFSIDIRTSKSLLMLPENIINTRLRFSLGRISSYRQRTGDWTEYCISSLPQRLQPLIIEDVNSFESNSYHPITILTELQLLGTTAVVVCSEANTETERSCREGVTRHEAPTSGQ